jgi:glutamine synthetase
MTQGVGISERYLSMNPEYVKKQIEKHKIGSIDLKYADLVGNWYHITFPARRPHPFEMNLYYNL